MVSDTGEGSVPSIASGRAQQQLDPAARGWGSAWPSSGTIVGTHWRTVQAASGGGPGQGATFRLRLPISVAAARRRPRAQAQRAPHARRRDAARSLAGTTILVVEDDPDAREMVTFLLRHADVVACGFADALREFERRPPDVLLSDIADATTWLLAHRCCN